MRGTGDRPLRCEPTTNRKKTGKRSAPSRVDARLLLWPSLLLSPRCSSFFDLTRLPIRNWKISPTKKRRETTTRVVGCRPASREGFSKESAARSMMRVWNVVVRSRFCPVVVFWWWCVARCSVLKRRWVVKYLSFALFFCGFFFAKRNKKTFFVPIACVFFPTDIQSRTPPHPRGRHATEHHRRETPSRARETMMHR